MVIRPHDAVITDVAHVAPATPQAVKTTAPSAPNAPLFDDSSWKAAVTDGIKDIVALNATGTSIAALPAGRIPKVSELIDILNTYVLNPKPGDPNYALLREALGPNGPPD